MLFAGSNPRRFGNQTHIGLKVVRLSIIIACALATLGTGIVRADDFAIPRRLMVGEIERMAVSLAGETGVAKFDQRVLNALTNIPRHEFLPKELASVAYTNRTLSIGHGQTISQPFVVALMTELLHVRATDKVLEIGTGSGYQSAILKTLLRPESAF